MTTEAAPATGRVLLHVGVPKSGTSFLQATLRANADRLREAGVLFPTQQHKGLFHAALEVTGNHPGWGVPQRRVKGSWARLCKQARAFEGTTVFSNELFSNARRPQVVAALRELDGMEVHVIVTARDLARQLPAEWQEGIKHGRGLGFKPFLDRMLDPARSHAHAQKFWRHQDIADLLDRWGADLPAERVHLVTAPPPGAPRDLLWQRFCAVIGVDPALAEFPEVGANTSLGITAIDVLRRVNRQLGRDGQRHPHLRRTVKQVLVNDALRRDQSPRVATPETLLPRLTEITDGWVKRIEAAGYDVVGDLADLQPRPTEGAPAEHRVPVRDSRALAVQAVAVLTKEVATLRAEVKEVERLRRRVAELESGPGRVGAVVRRVAARLRRD